MTSTLQVQTLQGPTSGADSNVIRIADGHTLVGGQGSIIQEQINVFPTRFDTTSDSYQQTGMAVAITPRLASSKIVVSSIFCIYFTATGGVNYGVVARLFNLNTSAQIGLGSNSDGFFYSRDIWGSGDGYVQFAVRAVDDQTNSTSLRTYGLAIRNHTAGDSMRVHKNFGANTITATEIAQ